jgi:hypothetical protein
VRDLGLLLVGAGRGLESRLCARYRRIVRRETEIRTASEAEREGFLGSPSVRVEGVDIDPTAAERSDYGLKSRLYRWRGGQSGQPPREWMERALRQASA